MIKRIFYGLFNDNQLRSYIKDVLYSEWKIVGVQESTLIFKKVVKEIEILITIHISDIQDTRLRNDL